jgi:phage/plasmid-like protein (TIGR03299 family)
MSHELSIDPNGKAEMMYVGKMPWHGLGAQLEEPPTAAKAIQAAHLEWKVVKKQLYIGEEHRPLPGQYAIVREDRWSSNEESVMGTVGRGYSPLQNIDAFRFFDPIVETGKAFYESAGALKNGQRVWVMARLKEDFAVTKEDTIARYLLLSNTHDGTGSVQVKFTPVRVVCQNTLSQALGQGPSIRVAHTLAMESRLKNAAEEALDTIQRHFDQIGVQFRKMATFEMSERHLDAYLRSAFPDPLRGKDERLHRRALAQTQKDRRESLRLYCEGMGNDLEGVRGTLWAAYNGVTEYLDFHRTAYGDGKWLENIWFGESSRIKERALEKALSMARVN